jgi:hypothetical protein
MRKIAWRLMIKAMPREVARFIQSRFGELKISEAKYEDLLSEADDHYPRYLGLLGSVLKCHPAIPPDSRGSFKASSHFHVRANDREYQAIDQYLFS